MADKPNILVIFGDDIGWSNLSCYNHGMMGYQTPNIDSLAQGGALFTDCYGEQSCTAGRAAFILGQQPFRTGLLTIGMPGSDHGITDWMPTIADLLKPLGYATGQFGKNHLGDRDQHLPTNHGFDEFFGNLYHLNAEEEPETYYYPKDPEFKRRFGPRGVIRSRAKGDGTQSVEDTGPLNVKRMETIDEEIFEHASGFLERSVSADKPFFCWFNTTRMHVWTHLKPESKGRTGIGLYADGMVEHDELIGKLLAKLDALGVTENTIVVYTTDNGAEVVTWPDGGTTPFHGEKGTTFEGGHRVPQVVRWPGVIQPGTKVNSMFSLQDWLPTLLAAVGEDDIVERLKHGYVAGGKNFRVHLDGYNFLPYLRGETQDPPREEYYYFDQGGNLNALRWRNWKLNLAQVRGNIATGVREMPAWPTIVNLRADPYEQMPFESGSYIRWYGDLLWLFIPVGQKLRQFFGEFEQYPYQTGSALNAGNLNYQTLRLREAMDRLQKVEELMPAA